MLALRLPEDIEKRLDNLAKRTGRSKSYYAREAIVFDNTSLYDNFVSVIVQYLVCQLVVGRRYVVMSRNGSGFEQRTGSLHRLSSRVCDAPGACASQLSGIHDVRAL